MKLPNETLANNLRTLREERNLSLDGLSDLTGVSKSMLRQIEIGQSNPTIETVWKIANGMKIPFTALLFENEPDVAVDAFKSGTPLKGKIAGYDLYPLINFSPERPFEFYYVEIEPGTTLNAEPHQGNAQEHVFVISGEMKITVADKTYNLPKGNFITFDADNYHKYENQNDEPAIAFMLISYLP